MIKKAIKLNPPERLQCFFKSRAGSAITLGMGLVLAACALMLVILTFSSVNAIIAHIRETGQAAIDSYTIETGRDIVQSIKSGNDYTNSLKVDKFLTRYEKELGVTSLYTGHNSDGRLIYRIRDMKTEFIYEDTLKTKVSFVLEYQFYFLSSPLFTKDFHIRLESRYNVK